MRTRTALLPACALAGWLGFAPAAAAAEDDLRLGDETAVNEAGECEVELATERSRRSRPAPTERSRGAEFACGIGGGSEIALAWARQRAGNEREDEALLGAKAELVAAEPGRPGWTVGVAVAAQRASGARWRRSGWEAVLETTLLPAERWLAELTLGTARDRTERRSRTLWSAAVEHALPGDAFELRAEVGGDDRTRPLVAFGLRWLFSEDAHLKVELGMRNGRERERTLAVGLKFEFDLGPGP